MKNQRLVTLSAMVIFCLMGSVAIATSQISEKASLENLVDKTVKRIAFGSCAKQWQHQTIWNGVLATKPDLWLFLGDTF